MPYTANQYRFIECPHLMQAKVQDLVDKSTEDDIKSEAVLGAFQIVRLIASRAKIDATVSMARSILEAESSIVIFTFFVEVAKEVHKKLRDAGWNGEVLVGEVPAAKRQTMVDNFQNGVSPVFIATFGAGGVGITLTAACTIILLDRYVFILRESYHISDAIFILIFHRI